MRPALLSVCLIFVATAASAQRIAVGVGPTWRGGTGGYAGFRRDAVTADFQLVNRADRLGWFVSLSATVGESAVAIPECAPPPAGQPAPCSSFTLVPGSLWTVAGGLAFGPPSGNVDLMVGPAFVHTTERLGPGQTATVLGFQGRIIARPLPIEAVGFGVDATYLTSRITTVRWQLSPRVEIRF